MFGIENGERIDRFLETHTNYSTGRAPLVLTPLDGGDGFFACELVRAPE
jgi:hypothetical protein